MRNEPSMISGETGFRAHPHRGMPCAPMTAMTETPPSRPRPASRWLKPLILALFAGGLAAFFLLGGDQYLSLENLKANRAALLEYTESHFSLMVILAIAIYTLSTALSIPGAVILSLAAGFLFGRWTGTAIILFSATLGATLVFLAARYLFADMARRRLGPMMHKLADGFQRDAFHYLLFLRLVPVFPFWLVNLAPAFTPIKTRTYFLATAIGIAPGSFVFANLGQSLGRIDNPDELLSGETLMALVLLGLLALVPVIYRRFREPRERNPGDSG